MNVERADSFWRRLIGLMGRRTLPDGTALLIAPCASVHTAWMRFAIDVVFVDRNGTVLKIVERVSPWRAVACRAASAVVELNAGHSRPHGVAVGQPFPATLGALS